MLGEREGALRCAGSTLALLGLGQAEFQLAFWQLFCPSGTLHEEQGKCAPELTILPDTSSA